MFESDFVRKLRNGTANHRRGRSGEIASPIDMPLRQCYRNSRLVAEPCFVGIVGDDREAVTCREVWLVFERFIGRNLARIAVDFEQVAGRPARRQRHQAMALRVADDISIRICYGKAIHPISVRRRENIRNSLDGIIRLGIALNVTNIAIAVDVKRPSRGIDILVRIRDELRCLKYRYILVRAGVIVTVTRHGVPKRIILFH